MSVSTAAADDLVAAGVVAAHGLADGTVEVRFQPIVSVETRRWVGAEALVRAFAADGTTVRNDLWIPDAEASPEGMARVDEWVADQSIRALAAFRELAPDMVMTINMSPRGRIAGYADAVLALVDHHGLPGSAVAVEVTETAVPSDRDALVAALRTLRDGGVGVLLDDFGTGFSSFDHLRSLPVTGIKLDRSFTAGVGTDDISTMIAMSVSDLAGRLGLDCVAEGVETDAMLERVAAFGFGKAQGWLFAPALPADVFAKGLAGESKVAAA